MSVTLALQESHSLIRLEGEYTLVSAAELKEALLEALAIGKDLHLNLEALENLDISAMQLLWAARKEAQRPGVKFVLAMPEAMVRTVREAGFEQFPGLATQAAPAIEE